MSSLPDAYKERGQAVVASLQSFFLVMPRGSSFLGFEDFLTAYETFREATGNGTDLRPDTVVKATRANPRCWVVLRAISGMSPPEAADLSKVAAEEQGEEVAIDQTVARQVDARSRRGETVLLDDPDAATQAARKDHEALMAMLAYLPGVIERGPDEVAEHEVHRLDKFDTSDGAASVQAALATDNPLYPVLLYERILGRPYASHRDSVSNIIGDVIEDRVMDLLNEKRIDARKTRPRERVPTFDQAGDIMVPSDRVSIDDVDVVIEAKGAEDDGTARDKVARILRLRANEDRRAAAGQKRRQVVAVVDGRGFRYRQPDLAAVLDACDGHVYTSSELELLVASGGPLHHLLPKS